MLRSYFERYIEAALRNLKTGSALDYRFTIVSETARFGEVSYHQDRLCLCPPPWTTPTSRTVTIGRLGRFVIVLGHLVRKCLNIILLQTQNVTDVSAHVYDEHPQFSNRPPECQRLEHYFYGEKLQLDAHNYHFFGVTENKMKTSAPVGPQQRSQQGLSTWWFKSRSTISMSVQPAPQESRTTPQRLSN